MAESTLSIAWQEHQARVGSFLGWGRGAAYGDTPWTNPQQFEIDGIVASALRRFYFPKPPEGSGVAHYDWTFLHPVASLAFASGAQAVTLPDDYGGSEGPVTVLTSSTVSQPWRVEWCNEALVRQRYSAVPSMTGPPMFVAETPLKGTTATAGQRFGLTLFPAADQAYTLQLAYYVNPDCLSAPFPYAYGGVAHAETILEACLAVAEERLDDAQTVHRAAFEERLAASISMDRRHQPAKLGYCADRSDRLSWERVNPHAWAAAATYNGSSFE